MNLALLKGASLVGEDSALKRKREPEVYDRVMKDLVGWLKASCMKALPICAFRFKSFVDVRSDQLSSRPWRCVVDMNNHHIMG